MIFILIAVLGIVCYRYGVEKGYNSGRLSRFQEVDINQIILNGGGVIKEYCRSKTLEAIHIYTIEKENVGKKPVTKRKR